MSLVSSKCSSAERDCRSSPVHHYIHCDTLHQPSCIAGCYQSVSIFHILVLKEAVKATSCINFFSTDQRHHDNMRRKEAIIDKNTINEIPLDTMYCQQAGTLIQEMAENLAFTSKCNPHNRFACISKMFIIMYINRHKIFSCISTLPIKCGKVPINKPQNIQMPNVLGMAWTEL